MRQKYKIMSSIILLLQGKKSRCPSIENQLQKLWNIHTIESYEAVRRKEKEFSILGSHLLLLCDSQGSSHYPSPG